MKQSTHSTGEKLSEDEIEVCEIMLNLRKLISTRFSFTWGGKRRRSALDSKPPLSYRQSDVERERRERETKVKEIQATSPSTPLSFSPSGSDSDDKSKQQHSSKRNSEKRTREEWMEIIDGLMQRRELLRGEVETVRSYYQKLKAINLELKAKKQELSCSQNADKPQLEINRNWNLGMNFLDPHYQITLFAPPPQPQFSFDHNKTIVEKTGKLHDPFGQKTPPMVSPQNNFNFNFNSSSSGLGLVNMGPRGIPDLNVSAEETFGLGSSQPLDLNRVLMDSNRVRAAEARTRRMMKIKKTKNSLSLKLSRCR